MVARLLTGLTLSLLLFTGCHSVGLTTGIIQIRQGDYFEAIEVINGVLAEDPDNAEACFQLGVAYSHLDSVGLAYQSFMKAFELEPWNLKRHRLAENNIQHNFVKHYTIGQSEFGRGGLASAAGAFKKATEADPRRGVGLYNLGVAYSRLAETEPGFRDDALRAFEDAVNRSKPEDKFHTAAIAALLKNHAITEDWDDAVRWGERYVSQDPDNRDVWLLLSQCYEHQGNAEKARECLVRAER